MVAVERQQMEHTILYRYFDNDANLLYVGITKNQFKRFSAHASKALWVSQINYATFEHFDTRSDALDAEAEAIRTENPKYNIAGVLEAKTAASPLNMHAMGLFMRSYDQHDDQHRDFAKAVQLGIAFDGNDTNGNPINLGKLLTGIQYIYLATKYAIDESDDYENLRSCEKCISFYGSDTFRNQVIDAWCQIDVATGVAAIDSEGIENVY